MGKLRGWNTYQDLPLCFSMAEIALAAFAHSCEPAAHVDRCTQSYCNSAIEVNSSEAIASAFLTMGWALPCPVMPAQATAFTPAELRLVYRHSQVSDCKGGKQ